MARIVSLLLLALSLGTAAAAADLYQVAIDTQADADIVNAAGVLPILRVSGGYLVLTEASTISRLQAAGVETQLIATDLTVDQLALDSRLDEQNVGRFPLVYRDANLRLFRVDKASKARSLDGLPLTPLMVMPLKIAYHPPLYFNKDFRLVGVSLDSLISLVSQDSLTSYLERLQAFYRRQFGTDSLKAARDWIFDKFQSFGYDSVVIDSFVSPGGTTGYNVVAYKIGSVFPGEQIVIGGHYDAVPSSPGADDNGTGTVGTMEMARVLKDIETEATFIFIAFDGEEVGLFGSVHYASNAAARGDTILYMLNMDMIGHLTNDTMAKLYLGPDDEAYAQLWGKLSDSLVGITGVLSGSSGGSDHAPFAQVGYDVTFVQEFNFSSHYHQPYDSTVYINFNYFTRMVKASLATVYTVQYAPPPVLITEVRDVGDGQSLRVKWVPHNPSRLDHYKIYYTTVPATQPDSSEAIPAADSQFIVSGLIEGQVYGFYIIGFDALGNSSIGFNRGYGAPYSAPMPPENVQALPLKDAIRVTWTDTERPLDLDHFTVIRDRIALPAVIYDTVYVDDDPALGSVLHNYLVVAVDTDANRSDTTGIIPDTMRAATLEPDRILAINRSGSNRSAQVNEAVTGEFIRSALEGWVYDYASDSSAVAPDHPRLLDFIDYGLLIIGGEAGRRQDDLTRNPDILADIAYYLDIGGKVILFGRWGSDITNLFDVDTALYAPNTSSYAYFTHFHTAFRVQPRTLLRPDTVLQSDLIGAHSLDVGYPDLIWDSLATLDHTSEGMGTFKGLTGIPCPSFPFLTGSGYDVIYTYDSNTDSELTEGEPMAWRYLGADYQYVFFNLPLSFMERPAALLALRQAVTELATPDDVDDDGVNAVPRNFALYQNHPNPFNPATVIEFYVPGRTSQAVTLEVFNILGQQVKILFDGPALPGMNRVEWDSRDGAGHGVASGIYFYRLKTDRESLTRKMLLLK